MSLTFDDTHNMVAYLNKSDASERFNQVIDFLNGNYINSGILLSSSRPMTSLGVIEEKDEAEEQVQDVVEDAAAQGVDTAVIGDAGRMIDDLDSDAGVALMDDKE
nr:hypothetical protein [Tanacetum cinerariifolium]